MVVLEIYFKMSLFSFFSTGSAALTNFFSISRLYPKKVWGLLLLSWFVCVYHPAVRVRIQIPPSILFSQILNNIEKRTKINKKRPGLAHFKKIAWINCALDVIWDHCTQPTLSGLSSPYECFVRWLPSFLCIRQKIYLDAFIHSGLFTFVSLSAFTPSPFRPVWRNG